MRVSVRWWPPRSSAGCTRVQGPVDQFNQTVVVQAPVGVTEADVVVVLQALLDRHAMLRLRVDDDGAGGWSLTVPEAGSVDARACLHTVDVLSDEAVIRGAVAVEPGGRGDAERAVGGPDGAVGADRSPLGRRWGVVADPAGGPQPRLGAASQSGSRWCCRRGGRRLPGGRRCWLSTRTTRTSWSRREAWRQIAATPAALPAVQPAVDTYATCRAACRWSWMPRRPACCSVRCRRRFMPGCTTFC